MRVALTGATGFVGSHVAEALARDGHDLTGLVRPRRSAPATSGPFRVVSGGLEDGSALARLVDGADALVHVAGLVAARSEAELLRVNAEGTERLARAARTAGVGRLLYVSSLAVTGPTLPGRPLDESAAPRPVTPYGRSKRAGEDAVRASGVPFTIVRPPAVYGPRDREMLRVFRLAAWGVAPLMGDGGQELSLAHATDVAEAVAAAVASPRTLGRVYHAAHPAIVTQRALVQAVARAVGRPVAIVPIPAPAVRGLLRLSGALSRLAGRASVLGPDKAEEFLAPAWTCSSEALARDAGWRARIALDDGLRETAVSYREAGWLR